MILIWAVEVAGKKEKTPLILKRLIKNLKLMSDEEISKDILNYFHGITKTTK